MVIGVFALGICQGSQSWESEDFPRPTKLVREVHRKQPKPLQTKDSAVTVDKKPEKAAVPADLGKTKLVHGVMEKKAYYCRENQTVDEALKSCASAAFHCLPVVDSNLQVVGVVRMRDLMRGDENRP
jgi:predicted transcriptional regulator